MTVTHSEKSVQQTFVAWPYRRERRGHDFAKKSLTADDSMQYLGSQGETHKKGTQAVAVIT